MTEINTDWDRVGLIAGNANQALAPTIQRSNFLYSKDIYTVLQSSVAPDSILQVILSRLPHRTVTSSLHWDILQLSVKRLG